MTVQRCDEKDIEAICETERAAFAEPLKGETIRKMMENGAYFYACENAEAFVCFEKVCDEGQIVSVACRPERRRQGLCTEIFETIKKNAGILGISFFTLEVRADNEAARALYKKCGFKETGVRKGYYQNPKCDAILMDLCMEEGK